MKTWNDYKEYVRTVDPETAKDIKETEEVAAIVTAMVEQRNALGLSQRELAAMPLIFQRKMSCTVSAASSSTISLV